MLDFALPGKMYTEEVSRVQKKKQRYYNAGGNSHNSYEVVTPKHQFSVAEDIAKSAKGKSMSYTVSLLFQEVNSYSILPSQDRSIYSFRLVSGFVLPLLLLLAIGIKFRFKKDLSILLFVLQLLVVGNFIWLLFW
ncbi:hypothetical protein NV36_00370 [Dokdonia donghaensis DSW-1]|uniref:Uncharacterized protein n=1 Tax=Dokdonia donghaensis DSW-1 TaxID=1300343 RepID=A0A0A2H5L3_9FLAO|nr:hypothetical protein NV36_00370 [Dokdonia donghaensis DSW-1]